MLTYQPTFNMLELKDKKGTEYVIAWKSKDYRIPILNHYLIIYHIV